MGLTNVGRTGVAAIEKSHTFKPRFASADARKRPFGLQQRAFEDCVVLSVDASATEEEVGDEEGLNGFAFENRLALS